MNRDQRCTCWATPVHHARCNGAIPVRLRCPVLGFGAPHGGSCLEAMAPSPQPALSRAGSWEQKLWKVQKSRCRVRTPAQHPAARQAGWGSSTAPGSPPGGRLPCTPRFEACRQLFNTNSQAVSFSLRATIPFASQMPNYSLRLISMPQGDGCQGKGSSG